MGLMRDLGFTEEDVNGPPLRNSRERYMGYTNLICIDQSILNLSIYIYMFTIYDQPTSEFKTYMPTIYP